MNEEFDLAIHLVGEQPWPVLLGVKCIKAKRHLMLASPKTQKQIEQIRRFDPNVESCVLKCVEDANLIEKNQEAVAQLCEGAGRVAVNLTGGTKPMAFGSVVGSRRKTDPTFFYFNTSNKQVQRWNDAGNVEVFPLKVVLTIDDFAKLFEFPVEEFSSEHIARMKARKECTQKLWKYRAALVERRGGQESLQTKAANSLKARNRTTRDFAPFSGGDESLSIAYELDDDNRPRGSIKVRWGNSGPLIPINDSKNWDDFLEYVAGRWFEEYAYLELDARRKELGLIDIRSNVVVRYETQENDAHEFDLLVSDGYKLYIVECKAGAVTAAHVENLVKRTTDYAGSQGLGVLLSIRDVKQKASDADKRAVETIEKSRPQPAVFCGKNCVADLCQTLTTCSGGFAK